MMQSLEFGETRKPLSQLLRGILPLDESEEIEVAGLCLDSRAVQADDCFIALQGHETHGLSYLNDALKAGASAVLSDIEYQGHAPQVEAGVPVLVIEKLREHLATIANRFYDYPSNELAVVAVTGTNGKTTVAATLAELLKLHYGGALYVGTLGIGCWPALFETANTTPDLLSLQKHFAACRSAGVKACALEASSHALAQNRMSGIAVDVAIFTNLSHEHLDYHGSMEAYAKAKFQLFKPPLGDAVINVDDSHGRELYEKLDAETCAWPYGLGEKAQGFSNLTTATSVKLGLHGIDMHVSSPCGEGWVHSPLIGDFNVSNLLGVIAALAALGLEFEQISQLLPSASVVPGRMQLVNGDSSGVDGHHPRVIVDYAHTPDGLEHSLKTLREITSGRVICVFGCGGDRDREKRPLMGKIAGQYADSVIVTSDNPRGESPPAIIEEILAGPSATEKFLVEPDRRKAISAAIANARHEDTILIAGKGHENTQLVQGAKLPFSDVEVAREILATTTAELES